MELPELIQQKINYYRCHPILDPIIIKLNQEYHTNVIPQADGSVFLREPFTIKTNPPFHGYRYKVRFNYRNMTKFHDHLVGNPDNIYKFNLKLLPGKVFIENAYINGCRDLPLCQRFLFTVNHHLDL